MRILYIITQADGGGAQNYTLALAGHFGGAIAAGSEDSKLFVAAQKIGLATFPLKYLRRRINPLRDFPAVWEIRQLIKTYNPDIVHLNSSKAGVLGSFAGIGLKKKIIFTAHGFIFNEPLSLPMRSFYLALEKTASDFRDYIICVSESDRKSALDNHLAGEKKLVTIHNGLGQINFFPKKEARGILGLNEDKIIIGCIANFYKTKGLDVLIEATAMLSGELKQKVRVALIGDGPERENLKSKIADLNLNSVISLPGKIPDAARYLKAFDIFTMPSRKEGLPFALLEAMQAGLPITAAKVGGIPEALGDAGLLVEPENPAALAQAIDRLAADQNLASELSQKAKERSKLFTQEKMLAETNKIYETVLKK